MQRGTVDDYLQEGCLRCALGATPQCKVHRWTAELQALRHIVLQSGLTETVKWGVPCYTHRGKNVVNIAALKEQVCLGFFKGSLLSDPAGILQKQGANSQEGRIIPITSTAQIQELEPMLAQYLQEAVLVEEAGLKTEKPATPTAAAWPEELQACFARHIGLQAAFEALTPGRQRGYLIHFSQPKQAATRLQRIEKAIPAILQGKGMHDDYKQQKATTPTLSAWLLVLAMLWAGLGTARAQAPQDSATHQVALLLKKYYNQKNIDSLYSLMGTAFQEKIKPEQLREGLLTQLAPYGSITEFVFEKNTNGVHKYKTVLQAGLTLQTLVSLDEQGKVYTYLMQPYKNEAAPRRSSIVSDNRLQTALDSAVDKAAKTYMLDTASKGLSIAVHVAGQDHFYNYGYASLQPQVPTTSQTVYEIGSITKTFAAYLLANLAQQGKLKVNDPVSKYLPDSVAANPALQKINLRHLSNHSSGLPRLPGDLMFTPGIQPLDPYAHYTDTMLFRYLKQLKAPRAPDSAYEYSNLAVGLLGVVLERVSGHSFASLVKKECTEAWNMRHTTAGNDLPPPMATGYNDKGAPTPYWAWKSLAAAGIIKSNATDLLQYGKKMLGILQPGHPAHLPALTHITWNRPPQVVTLGWHRNPAEEKTAIYQHGGGTYGFRSQLMVCPAQQWVVVTLANHGVDPGASQVAGIIQQYLENKP